MFHPSLPELIFIILATIFFILPFLVWVVIRFREKVLQKISLHHKWVLTGAFIGGMVLFLIFLVTVF